MSGKRDSTPLPVLVPDSKPPDRYAATKERSAWLGDWAKNHASASVHEAREAVKKQFGVSLGTALINIIMKQARVNAGLPILKRGRPVTGYQGTSVVASQRMDALVDELRQMGVRRIEIADTDYRAELTITRGKK